MRRPASSVRSIFVRRVAAATILSLAGSAAARAGLVEYQDSGTITTPLGASIPAGTAFSGTFAYDFPQAGTVTPFEGGTQSVFTFQSLTLTVGGQTVTVGPGQPGLYNDVNPPTGSGVPKGDSLFTFIPGIPNNTPNPSTGSLPGLQPNFIYLGFVDSTGKVFSGPGLP
jgi:hypothetical protein